MSVEDLKEYARRCATEPELRARAKAIGFQDPDGHIRHAESLGLEVGVEDVIAYRSEMAGDEEISELSEEDLDQIAGGVVTAVVAAAVGVGVGAAVGVGVGVGVGAGVGAIASSDGGGW